MDSRQWNGVTTTFECWYRYTWPDFNLAMTVWSSELLFRSIWAHSIKYDRLWIFFLFRLSCGTSGAPDQWKNIQDAYWKTDLYTGIKKTRLPSSLSSSLLRFCNSDFSTRELCQEYIIAYVSECTNTPSTGPAVLSPRFHWGQTINMWDIKGLPCTQKIKTNIEVLLSFLVSS